VINSLKLSPRQANREPSGVWCRPGSNRQHMYFFTDLATIPEYFDLSLIRILFSHEEFHLGCSALRWSFREVSLMDMASIRTLEYVHSHS
jgi:hypothetical protein